MAPFEFYLFPGPYRDFLIYLIEWGGGKISSTLSEKTHNITGGLFDYPPDVQFDVLGVDYIFTSLKTKRTLDPANFVMHGDYEYPKSFVKDFRYYYTIYKKKFWGERPRANASQNGTPPRLAADVANASGSVCAAGTNKPTEDGKPGPAETEEDGGSPTDLAGSVSRETDGEHRSDRVRGEAKCPSPVEETYTDGEQRSDRVRGEAKCPSPVEETYTDGEQRSDRVRGEAKCPSPVEETYTDGEQRSDRVRGEAKCLSPVEETYTKGGQRSDRVRGEAKCPSPVEETNVNGRGTNVTRHDRVPTRSDSRTGMKRGRMKESAQNPMVVDLTESPTLDSETSSDKRRRSQAESPKKKRRPFGSGGKPVPMSDSDTEFAEESKDKFPLACNKKRSARLQYSRQEQVCILTFIKDHDLYSCVKGTYIWKLMEKKRVLSRRSWQSMSEQFRKKILPNVVLFDDILSQNEIAKFEKIFCPNNKPVHTSVEGKKSKGIVLDERTTASQDELVVSPLGSRGAGRALRSDTRASTPAAHSSPRDDSDPPPSTLRARRRLRDDSDPPTSTPKTRRKLRDDSDPPTSTPKTRRRLRDDSDTPTSTPKARRRLRDDSDTSTSTPKTRRRLRDDSDTSTSTPKTRRRLRDDSDTPTSTPKTFRRLRDRSDTSDTSTPKTSHGRYHSDGSTASPSLPNSKHKSPQFNYCQRLRSSGFGAYLEKIINE